MLALVGVVVSAVQEERERAQPNSAYYNASYTDTLLAACLRVDNNERAPSQRACEEAGNQADLQAQRGMADAAWAQVGLNAGSVALLFATVFFAYRAWREAKRSAKAGKRAAKEARRQADAAETQLADSRKPFIWVEYVNAKLNGPNPEVEIRIVNVGDKGAVISGGRAKIVYSDKIPTTPRTRVEMDAPNVCIFGLDSPKLMPGDHISERLVMTQPDANAGKVGFKLWVYGLIDYMGPSHEDYTLPIIAFGGRGEMVPLTAAKPWVMTRSEEIKQGIEDERANQGTRS